VGAALLAVELALLACSMVEFSWQRLNVWFDLNGEGNIPTWFSSMQLYTVAALAAYLGWRERASARLSAGAGGWWVVMAMFLYLSMDETVQIHEVSGHLLTRVVPLSGFREPVFYWLVALLPVMVFGAWYLGMFVWRRLRGHPRLLALSLAGLACWAAVPFAELIDALGALQGWRLTLLRSAEEGLEMVGATCFLALFLRYAAGLRAPGDGLR
jgi:hypothetical protein